MSRAKELCVCLLSPEEQAAIENNKRFNRYIELERRLRRNEFKLLLLGPGESGKSTFLKQMRIIHGSGFSNIERKKYLHVMYKNVCEGMQNIIQTMEKHAIPFVSDGNAEKAAEFVEVHFTLTCKYREKYLEILRTLWEDPGCKKCLTLKFEFHLQESAKYFLPKLNEILKPDYIPSQQDIIFSRYPTATVDEYTIPMENKSCRIVDVGGQRSERQKWLSCFENVTAVLFLAAVSEYDQCLYEDPNRNRLCESVDLFEVIISARHFQYSSIILFLNKFDVFKEKIQYVSIKKYFFDFNGKEKDIKSAMAFVMKKFQTVNKTSARIIYTHFTCATDTENMKFMCEAIKDIVLQRNLQQYNLA